MKFTKTLLSASLFFALSQNIYAKDANAEIGWRFGHFEDVNSTKKTSKAPKTQKEILKKMLEVQEEQLETQKKILKVLKNQFDPEPETIMVDGKPCIANSSAKCYKWMPEPEAKKYPIIAKFFSNPTVDNAAQYIQWYSKHTNHATKAGMALYLAKYQYGDNATNFNTKKTGMLGSRGEYSQAEYATKLKLFKNNLNKFYINLYLGRGLDVDVFGLKSIAILLEKVPELKLNVFYYNDDVKNKLHAIADKYIYIKRIFKQTAKSYSGSAVFQTNGIYSTPALELVLLSDKSSQIMGTGRVSPTGFISKVLRYLWYKGEIKKNGYVSDYKMWDNSTYVKDTMHDELGEDIDVSKYQYKNNQMKPKKLTK